MTAKLFLGIQAWYLKCQDFERWIRRDAMIWLPDRNRASPSPDWGTASKQNKQNGSDYTIELFWKVGDES